MKVFRRIFGNIDTQEKKNLIESIFNFPFEWGYFTKDVDEKSEEYEHIKSIASKNGWHDSVIGTEFSKQEIYDSGVLYFKGAKAFSFPEPQDYLKFLENTYFDCCKKCGIHGEQKSVFEIKKESSLGSGGLGTLHWVFDELFVTKELYKRYFKGLDIDSKLVKLYKKNRYAENMIQLIIPMLDNSLDMTNFESSRCEICGSVKYSPSINGFFPMPGERSFHITKTREFFGSGHSASQRILVNNDVMQKMIQLKMAKYHQFVPCEKVVKGSL